MFNSENFSYKVFIDYIIDKMKLSNEDPLLVAKIEKEIGRTLGDRIILSVMNAMKEDDVLQFETMRLQNETMSDFEIIYVMVDDMPILYEVMMKGVNDLADDLLYDVERLDAVLEEKKQKVKSKK